MQVKNYLKHKQDMDMNMIDMNGYYNNINNERRFSPKIKKKIWSICT